MKRGLSGWEKALLVVPLACAAAVWQARPVLHAVHLIFPRTVLPLTVGNLDRVHFSNDGKYLVASSHESATAVWPPTQYVFTVTMWETATGVQLWQQRRVLPAVKRCFFAMNFSPDASEILTLETRYSADSRLGTGVPATISVCRTSNGVVVRKFVLPDISRVFYVDAGRKIFCEGTPSRILDSSSSRTLATTADRPSASDTFKFSEKGMTGLLFKEIGPRGKTAFRIDHWDFSAPRIANTFAQLPLKYADYSTHMAISRNGKLACTAEDLKPKATIWDVATGQPLRNIPNPHFKKIYFSPNNRFLLCYRDPRDAAHNVISVMSLYDCSTGRFVWTYQEPPEPTSHSRYFQNIKFSEDSQYIVTSDLDGVRWHDIQTGRIVYRLAGRDIRFSPDQKTMAILTKRGLEIHPVPTLPAGPQK